MKKLFARMKLTARRSMELLSSFAITLSENGSNFARLPNSMFTRSRCLFDAFPLKSEKSKNNIFSEMEHSSLVFQPDNHCVMDI